MIKYTAIIGGRSFMLRVIDIFLRRFHKMANAKYSSLPNWNTWQSFS
jgi:hypothetical protein